MEGIQKDLMQVKELLDMNDFNKVYHKSVSCIRKHPEVAQFWVYLGQSLLHCSYGKMADKVFKRAILLDPKAGWSKDIPELISRTKAGPDIDEVLNLLNTEKPKVTAAVICKNEARCIGRCLASITDAVDEILVIDTGSTDDTIEIAKTFPKARIINFEWCNDFSAARNFGMKHVDTEWVIWIDADEYIETEDISVVREVAGIFQNVPKCIIGIVRNDIINCRIHDDYGEYRMFKIEDNFKYWGKIHEHVGGVIDPDDPEIYRAFVRIRFFHDGYNKEQLADQKKVERNLKLLEEEATKNPLDIRMLYFYGRELYAFGNSQKSAEILRKAESLSITQNKEDIRRSVNLLQIKVYISLGEFDLAEESCNKLLTRYPDFPEALFYLAEIQFQRGKEYLRESEKYILKTSKAFKEYNGHLLPDSDIKDYKLELLHADILRHLCK